MRAAKLKSGKQHASRRKHAFKNKTSVVRNRKQQTGENNPPPECLAARLAT